MRIRSRSIISSLGVVLLITACDTTTEPTGALVSVCHGSGSSGRIVDVRSSELSRHLQHGDYFVHLIVSEQNVFGQDGIHFTKIGDALSAARSGRLARSETQTAACRITIAVDSGVYQGTLDGTDVAGMDKWPLIIDVPQISLLGAFKMHLDNEGRAAGINEQEGATLLLPATPLEADEFSQPLIIVDGHPNGSAGHGATIEGFVLRSNRDEEEDGPGGQGIFALRVHDVTVSGNQIEGPFTESIDLRASTGVVDRNYLSGVGASCDICLAGPGSYEASGNRLISGGIPGFLIVATTLILVDTLIEQYDLPTTAAVTATITNNEVRNHLRQPVGAGLRVGAIGVGSSAVVGMATVVAHDNLFDNNTFGVIVEAGFPAAGTVLRGDIDLALGGNTISNSCQHDLLVAFSRHTTVLGLSDFPYLHDSHYTLSLGGDLDWSDAWYGHPGGYGNALTVDGVTIPNGSRAEYDEEKSCDPVNPRRYQTIESRASLAR